MVVVVVMDVVVMVVWCSVNAGGLVVFMLVIGAGPKHIAHSLKNMKRHDETRKSQPAPRRTAR